MKIRPVAPICTARWMQITEAIKWKEGCKRLREKSCSASITLYSATNQDHVRSNYFLYSQNPSVGDYFNTSYRVFKKKGLKAHRV